LAAEKTAYIGVLDDRCVERVSRDAPDRTLPKHGGLMPPSATVSDLSVKKSTTPRVTAESMATKQRDISVSEFFAKNRHLLGFDNPRKALLTTVKEAVDNSLDACEEAGILPDLTVVIEDLDTGPRDGREKTTDEGKKSKAPQSSRYRVTVIDNGPGIVRKQVENIFGRLLYGSKFHRLKMSRGQQGIGISAAGMYGLITTGKPMVIHTKPKPMQPAHHIELAMNTKTNRAEVTVDDETEDFPPARFSTLTAGTRELVRDGVFLTASQYPTGTSVSIDLEGRYQKGRGSVDEFLELTAIANPHARITFVPPARVSADEEPEIEFVKGKGNAASVLAVIAADAAPSKAALKEPAQTTEMGGVILFPRAVNELPPETKEIQPHPKGIELGILIQMLKEAELEKPGYTLYQFLQDKFCRVSGSSATDLCSSIKVSSRAKVADIDSEKAEQLFQAIQDAKLPPPPTDCLAPIGVRQLLAGMLKGVKAEFYAASSREAAIYRGRPFQIEAGIAFGGDLPTEDAARVIRFANRVPLLFQQSACSSFKAVSETAWRNYTLGQPKGSLPTGPLVIMLHMASVWVPFTSESKEAIADYDEIRKEMKLALMECGRKLGTYLRKRAKMRRESERRDVFERYIGEIAKAVNSINGTDAKKLYDALLEQARRRTAVADLHLDEDGRAVKDEDPLDQDGVLIIESAIAPSPEAGTGGRPNDATGSGLPLTLSRAEAAALKVAAMQAQTDDDEPRLIDTRAVTRTGSKPSRSTSPKPAKAIQKTAAPPSKKSTAPKASAPAAALPEPKPQPKTQPKPESKAQPASEAKPTKPRLRKVNGEWIRIDEPGLF